MKILLGCGDYETISGAPMFVYSLAAELSSRGHEVHVAAPNVGGVMQEKTLEAGVTCSTFEGLARKSFDVCHMSGIHASQWGAHSRFPAIVTVHGTLIYETPYVHEGISHYACVRPQVREKVTQKDGISASKTSVIFNGVDRTRFNPSDPKFDPPCVLFAGTVDYLRAQATGMVMDLAKERGWEVLFVGRKLSGQMNDLPSHGRYWEGDMWNIEEPLSKCIATAGILLGRTTIEGWACGLPGIIYEIDNDGNVVDWGEYSPPPPQLMELFDIRHMASEYEGLYERVQ